MKATHKETGEEKQVTHGLMREGDWSRLQDVINPFTGRGIYGGQESGDIENGKVLVSIGIDDFVKGHESYFTDKQWKEITQEQYDEALCCCPPLRMFPGGFVMLEALTNDIHGWHMKVNGRYWCANKPADSGIQAMKDEILAQIATEGRI